MEHREPAPQLNQARLLLTKVGGGSGHYAHAGGKEASELVLDQVIKHSKNKPGNVLDIGSGFGGTADDIYQRGFHHIWGVDIDPAAVQFANTHYPHIKFVVGDAATVDKLFDPAFFSYFYFFNVLYAIEDKKVVLKKLAKLAKSGALLTIFDYTTTSDNLGLIDFAGRPIRPIDLRTIKGLLKETGWDLVEIVDLSSHYSHWYQELLSELDQEKASLCAEFSPQEFQRVTSAFTKMVRMIAEGTLGGALVFAKKTP